MACFAVLGIAEVPKYEVLRPQLPSPILEGKPLWIETYWKAWELAFRHYHVPQPGSALVSPLIDAAFSDNIYFWDTAFLTMFSNVAHPLVPGIGSLDNFYARQHRSGLIAREIVRATGEDYTKWVNHERKPLFSRWGWDGFGKKMRPLGPDAAVVYRDRQPPAEIPELTLDALNHPIAAWAELESFRVTGDRERLKRVRTPLEAYYRALQKHLRQGNGLYITDWASMDDSPRNSYLKGGGTGVDISAEMALFAANLAQIAEITGNSAAARRFTEEAGELRGAINRLMWDPDANFYFDLALDGRRAPVKTIAAFWTLLAQVASRDQAEKLVAALRNPALFGRAHRVPSVAASEPSYAPGGYWRGAVWAPMNTVVIRGLEKYGYDDLAREIALEHVDAVARSNERTGTIWENYSAEGARPGRPARPDFVGWSGIGPILYLLEYGVGLKPDAPENTLSWRVAGALRSGCERYRFNGHVVDLLAERSPDGGVSATIVSSGEFDLLATVDGAEKKIRVRRGRQQVTLAEPRQPAATAQAGPLPPTALRTEYLTDPIAIDTLRPRFSWVPQHHARVQVQSAYQVQVFDNDAAQGAAAWDSGRVQASDTAQVEYAGKPLVSDRTYHWRVRYWDSAGRASDFSRSARFDTALLQQSDWKAQWIGGGNLLRNEFVLDQRPVRARVYICGLGFNELWVNGARAGNQVLDPGWTTYAKRALYTTHDVTPLLRAGRNAIGVMLGQGRAGKRVLLLQLHVLLPDGRTRVITSGPEWRVADGPILSDSIYDGEVYDARRAAAGWSEPGFDAGAWRTAAIAAAPTAHLSAQAMPPIRVTGTLQARAVTNPIPGVYVFDFGQVFSGWVRLRVSGAAGTPVRMRHAELLHEDGTVNTETLRNARAEDVFILGGSGQETYEPRFTYHGFRYVEVTGYPGTPDAAALEARVAHSAVDDAGKFSSSNPFLNRLQEAIRWSQRTNLHSIPTDNNQRDERLGWLGDAHVTFEVASLNFDMAALYSNFLRNIADAQRADGSVPDTVPYESGREPPDPAWGSAYPLLVWHMLRYYGDIRAAAEHYDAVKKFVDYLGAQAASRDQVLLASTQFGDWMAIEPTPGTLVSNFYYILDAEIVARLARLLGRDDDQRHYSALAARLRAEFDRQYFDAAAGHYGTGSQTAQLLALHLDAADESRRQSAMRALVDNITLRNNFHLTTGVIGTRFLLPVLTTLGRSDLAYELLTQRTYPSWGYMLSEGATGIWETWQKRAGRRMASQNQPMFGSAGQWLYQGLAGIRMADDANAFRRIVIAPQVPAGLASVASTLRTMSGDVSVQWKHDAVARRFTLAVQIPVNVTAVVRVPAFGWRNVALQENGKVLASTKTRAGELELELGSGNYELILREER